MHQMRGWPPLEQRFEFTFQLQLWFELAVGQKVLHKRAIQRTWDVSGHRVQRLDLTPKTLFCASIKKNLIVLIQCLQNLIGRCRSRSRRP